MQQAVGFIRHYQYITQVVDGKKSRRQPDADVVVNSVQTDTRLSDLEKAVSHPRAMFFGKQSSVLAVKKVDITGQTAQRTRSQEKQSQQTRLHPFL